MTLFYLCPLEKARTIQCEWHGIDLENGMWLIAVRWQTEVDESKFASDPAVHVLPHPIFESNVPMKKEHVAHVAHMLPKTHGAPAWFDQYCTIHDLLREAVKISPQFRLRVI